MSLEEEIYRPANNQALAWYTYECGHCESITAGFVLALSPRSSKPGADFKSAWLRCSNPNCNKGTVLADGKLFPESLQGVSVVGLPGEVESAYIEARRCFSVGAYTACELMCRKILMHAACDKGDTEGKSFEDYIDFLKEKGFVTTSMKKWVDIIRHNGNKSIHRLEAPERERAESTLMFTGHLLKSIYEMDALAARYTK